MDNADTFENTQNNNEGQEYVALAKRCPNSDCFLYMKPQPGRTWCVECDAELVY